MQPVKYIVLQTSLIHDRLYQPGETVEYAGLPAENLQPTCDVGRARHQEYLLRPGTPAGDAAARTKEQAALAAAIVGEHAATTNAQLAQLGTAVKALVDGQAALTAAVAAASTSAGSAPESIA